MSHFILEPTVDMSLSTLLVGIFIATLVVLFITYIILSAMRPSVLKGLSPKVGGLQSPVKVGSSADVRDSFLSPPGSTFSSYFYCTINNKTQTIGRQQDPIALFSMGSAVRFEILPGGASAPPKTRLLVKTQGPLSAPEEIPVAQFPEQRWIHLAIVREGRRFTVYYNGEAVSSSRTQYFPVVNSSQLTIGDARLRGEFALPVIAPVPLRIEEIQSELRDTSNTRHEPYKPTDITAVFANLGCPNGLFCFSTSSPPKADPLKMWSTPYA